MDYIERTVGQFPISIGTSLALEGLFEIHPTQPTMPSGHRRITHLWVNLRTMIRNFYAAIPTEQLPKTPMNQALELFLTELRALYAVFQQSDRRHFQVVVYYNSMENLKWDFPHALMKKPKTEKQLMLDHMETVLTKLVLDNAVEQQLHILPIRKRPMSTNNVVAILTHYPYELLWRFEFDTLFLLESHTGKLKPYSQWFTKLNGVRAEDHIPFNKLMIQLFGDKTLFEPFPKKLLDEVRQIAATRNWSAVTSSEKIMDNIRNYGGETLKKTCKELT